MYGLVNRAVEHLVCQRFGERPWDEIKRRAGVEEEVFISNQAYPDALTYRLVHAASEVLGLPPDRILEAFGEFWVLHTAPESYGDLLVAHGRTFAEFMTHLPQFHTRVSLIFPQLQPPAFEVRDVGPHSLRLDYRSARPGLGAFVVGLLRGLGRRFQTEVRVTRLESRPASGSDDTFLVEWTAPGAAAAA